MILPTDIKSLELSQSMIFSAQKEEELRSKTYIKEAVIKFNHQVEVEKEFLAHHRWVCPHTIEDTILDKIHDLKMSPLGSRKDESSDKFTLDPDSLNHLACVAQNIDLFDGPNLRTGYNFIKKIISNVRMIGTESAFGYAMKASLYDRYKDSIVIKAPRSTRKYTEDATNHEIVAGKILNSLRSYIPNFAYILGSFNCGPPIIKPDNGKLIAWCRSGAQVKYMMYENVKNAVSFYEYVKTCSAQEYIDIIIQINYALMFAFKKVGFTHYDLHGENLLIKDIPSEEDAYYIPYDGDFVYASKIAMFIDYGNTHVYHPETKESLGFKDPDGPKNSIRYFSDGIYMDRPHPLLDSYKSLIATLAQMKSYNREEYEKVKGLLYYFHTTEENVDQLLKGPYEKVPYFGSQDYMEKINKFRHEDFIRYCRAYCRANQFTDPVVSGKEYTEELDPYVLFPGSKRITPDLSKNFKLEIDTIEELFDIIEPIVVYNEHLATQRDGTSTMSNVSAVKIESYSKLLGKIFTKILKERDLIIEILNKELEDIKSELEDIVLPKFEGISERNVYLLRSPEPLKRYMQEFENAIKYLDALDLIEKKLEMIAYVDSNIIHSVEDNLRNTEELFKRTDSRKSLVKLIDKDSKSFGGYLDSKEKLDKNDLKIETVMEGLYYSIPSEKKRA
jgi:hypothetical protein